MQLSGEVFWTVYAADCQVCVCVFGFVRKVDEQKSTENILFS